MRTRRSGIAIAFATLWTLGIIAFGCGGGGDDDDDDDASKPAECEDPATADEAGPGGFASDFATSGAFFALSDDFVEGTGPHGDVRIWYSTNIQELVGETCFEVPEGTTAIKEEDLDGDAARDAFVLMVKKSAGYDPENNDWYYEQLDADGNPTGEPEPGGRIGLCINCHQGAANTDYLYGPTL